MSAAEKRVPPNAVLVFRATEHAPACGKLDACGEKLVPGLFYVSAVRDTDEHIVAGPFGDADDAEAARARFEAPPEQRPIVAFQQFEAHIERTGAESRMRQEQEDTTRLRTLLAAFELADVAVTGPRVQLGDVTLFSQSGEWEPELHAEVRCAQCRRGFTVRVNSLAFLGRLMSGDTAADHYNCPARNGQRERTPVERIGGLSDFESRVIEGMRGMIVHALDDLRTDAAEAGRSW